MLKNLRYVKTVGYGGDDTLYYDPKAECGEVSDPVALWHNAETAWVVSLADLRRIVKEAEEARHGK